MIDRNSFTLNTKNNTKAVLIIGYSNPINPVNCFFCFGNCRICSLKKPLKCFPSFSTGSSRRFNIGGWLFYGLTIHWFNFHLDTLQLKILRTCVHGKLKLPNSLKGFLSYARFAVGFSPGGIIAGQIVCVNIIMRTCRVNADSCVQEGG